MVSLMIAMRTIRARGGVTALHVAILAAGHVFIGANGNIIGAADRVVVLAEAGDGNVVTRRASGERESECQYDDV